MFFDEIKKSKYHVISAVFFGIGSSVLTIALVSLITGAMVTSDNNPEFIDLTLFGLAVAGVLFFTFMSQWLVANLNASIVFNIRTKLSRSIANTSYDIIEKLGGHKLNASLAIDVANISSALALLPGIIIRVLTAVLGLVYLCHLSFSLFALFCLALLVVLVVSINRIFKLNTAISEAREQDDQVFKSYRTMIDGVKELNINQNRRAFFYENQVEPCMEKVREKELGVQWHLVIAQSWGTSCVFIILGLIVLYGGNLVGASKEVITEFVVIALYLVQPIAFVMNAIQPLMKGRESSRKISRLNLIKEQDKKVDTSRVVINPDWKSINFSNVRFHYDNNEDYQFKVGPIDLSIYKGEVLFIRGGNGAGKSSFIKLLVGLYDFDSGHVSIDDTLINQENRSWYKNHFTTVFSDYFLFEHILNKEGKLIEDRVIDDRIKALKLDDKIRVVDGKLSTTKLSQGQLKRLALLIAYAEDAEVFVFDEWAADQDPYFREYFYRVLLKELKEQNKTVVVISHDESYFDVADRICEFDSGKISSITVNKTAICA